MKNSRRGGLSLPHGLFTMRRRGRANCDAGRFGWIVGEILSSLFSGVVVFGCLVIVAGFFVHVPVALDAQVEPMWRPAAGGIGRTPQAKGAVSDKPIYEMSLAPDCRAALCRGHSADAEVHDLRTGGVRRVLHLSGARSRATCISLSPDGKRIATGHLDGRLALWNGRRFHQPRKTWTAHAFGVTDVVFSRDGRSLVTAGGDHEVSVWDAESGARLQQLAHCEPVIDLAGSRDAAYVAALGRTGTIRLWETTTWRLRWEATTHESRTTAVSFSPDGRWLLSCGLDQVVRLWDTRTGDVAWSAPTKCEMRTGAFSPNGRHFVLGDVRGDVHLWDFSSRCRLEAWNAHAGTVTCLQFSQDGRFLFSSGHDGSIQKFDWDEDIVSSASAYRHDPAVAPRPSPIPPEESGVRT